MRIALSIFISTLVLFHQTSFGLEFHYCSDKLSSISLYSDKSSDSSGCGVCTKANSCCQNIVQVNEVQQVHPQVLQVKLSAVAVLSFYSVFFSVNIDCPKQALQPFSLAVVDDEPPRYLKHRQFRL
ncbi:MAG: hypothetical protein MUF42_11440 [Cytophagaceae bacterium]|nr:hypothetical protein [Cytophagaceae bacterium]